MRRGTYDMSTARELNCPEQIDPLPWLYDTLLGRDRDARADKTSHRVAGRQCWPVSICSRDTRE